MDDDVLARFRRAYWRAFRELDSVRLRQWEEYRLTLPQLRVLYHIRRTPGVTGGEIAAALGITVSTVSGLVGKLTDRGLLARGTAPDDRRQTPLNLTPEGLTLVGTLSEAGRDFTARVAATLGGDLDGVTAALELLAAASEGLHVAPEELPAEAAAPQAPPAAATEAPPAHRRVQRDFHRGTVTAAHPDHTFTVALDDGRAVETRLSANLRNAFARVAVGDAVIIEFSLYDSAKSRIDSILR